METQSRYVSMLLILVSLTLFISQCDQIPPQNCSTYDTAKFIGNYNVSEFCQQGFGHGFTFATINPGNGAENELDFVNFINSGFINERNYSFMYLICLSVIGINEDNFE